MSDEEGFLAAIRAAPNDSAVRLVYADWLDEHGRPGGEFLRMECEIAALDPEEFDKREKLRAEAVEAGVMDLTPPNFLDSYYWKRTHLVASLRVARHGLEDDWMAPSPGFRWVRSMPAIEKFSPC